MSDSPYDLVDDLPPGAGRVAAWSAYALQTYGDKVMAHPGGSYEARDEARAVADACHTLAVDCVRCARSPEGEGGLPGRLPRWRTPLRDAEQLRGMREALEALRIHIAYDLERRGGDEAPGAELRTELAHVDERLAKVELLWIERPPPELRGGIGDALVTGLDRAYALGQRLASG
ncbi:MAG TPA: hypothetical protein VLW49_11710 [Gaiellaceae bacterium]|nr:hypothetical protein [Gaiellaceae bacterium]